MHARRLPAALLVPAVSGLYGCARKGAAVASFHNFTLASARFTSTGNSTSNSNAASMSSGFMKSDNVINDDTKTMPTSTSSTTMAMPMSLSTLFAPPLSPASPDPTTFTIACAPSNPPSPSHPPTFQRRHTRRPPTST
ncbi:hypothetical protein B0H13DRAFT_2097461 [Mycena leptocephala]|nr:hypothetical protein B0H13DRAFT_2097461 [Mycena leptocephala]